MVAALWVHCLRYVMWLVSVCAGRSSLVLAVISVAQGSTHIQTARVRHTHIKSDVCKHHCLYYLDSNFIYFISQCALVILVHLWTPAVPFRVSVTADPTTVVPNVSSVHLDTTPIPAAHVSHMTLITG